MMNLRVIARAKPLVPTALLAVNEAAVALGRRLLLLSASRLEALRGAAGDGFLLIVAETDALPWSDGVVYLGRDPEAPGLLMPTTSSVDVPLALFERALSRRFAREAQRPPPPFAVCFSPWFVTGAGAARRIERPELEAWLAGARASAS